MLKSLDRLVTAGRVRSYAGLLVCGYLAAWCWLILTLRHGLDGRGKPLGADFIIFYGASRLTLEGHAALAYAAPALLMAERQAVAASRGLFLWCYPPTFQLLVWPLGLLRYGAALAAWTAGGLAAYLAMIRLIGAERRALLLALAFPGVFVCATQGQTGLLIAGLMGGGLLLLDERPIIAGALVGLMAIKPHLAILLPLLLVGGGKWKAAASAAACAGTLALAATLVFGAGSWIDFAHAARAASAAFASGALPISKSPSAFAALLQVGFPAPIALAVHAVLALAAIALAWRGWKRPGALELKAGMAVIATLIVLPYSFDYDLVLLAIPIGVGLKAIAGGTAPSGAKSTLVLLAVTPIIIGPIAKAIHIDIGPAALWCGLLLMRRLLQSSSDRSPAARPRRPLPAIVAGSRR